jgi:uncharacterized membrane protein
MVNLLTICIIINLTGYLIGFVFIIFAFLDPNDKTTKRELLVHILIWIYLGIISYLLWKYLMTFPYDISF